MKAFGWLVAAAISLGANSLRAAPEAELLDAMAGTWSVQQRMWTGHGAAPTELPDAVAQRDVIRGMYLSEVMHPADPRTDQAAAFTRHAFLNYNPVTRRYEYSSLDSRAPQLMVERSGPSKPQSEPQELKLQGGTFLAPEWGAQKNITFAYRLTVGPVEQGKQTVRLFLTPQSGLPKKEFLAFEYLYSKRL